MDIIKVIMEHALHLLE